jgi:signal transduction histidine kinase
MQSGVPLINHEEPNDTLGGVERWFSTTKVAIRDEQGQVAGFVGECREITERKRYEADLARRNAELSALYAKLSETQEQLIESEKLAALGFMVAGIAHELNTPIGNALLATTTLVQQARDFFDTAVSGLTRSMLARYIEDASDVGDIVLRNLQRAAELITNFKQVAAIDGSGAPRAAFLLNNVIAEALLLLAPQVRQTSCVIDQDIAGEIRMNSYPGALQQVLLNLLDNALLHGLAGRTSGRIVITARLESEACLFLSVSDNGHGITADHLRHVFEPFYTTRLGVGGSGLGLNITHSIVTGILGGRITARSEPGSGSSFELLLPIEAPSGPQLPRA